MTPPARTLATMLWVGLAMSIAGRLLDLQWHATHDEFETASDQFRAHWLAWLGALVLLAAAALALAQGRRGLAVTAVVVGAAGYAVAALWHFYEHSQHRDPDLPHVLLTVAQIVMLVGTPLAARSFVDNGRSTPCVRRSPAEKEVGIAPMMGRLKRRSTTALRKTSLDDVQKAP